MRRKKSYLLIFLCLLAISCRLEKDYNPAVHLSPAEQEEIMDKVLRYMAKPPDGISTEERFYRGYDEHYAEQRRIHRLDAYYIEGKTHYFLFSRVAPSLKEKRIAIGGKLELDDQRHLSYYEEVFRTWRLEPDTLVTRSVFLFDKMVRDEDLQPYYSSRSGNTDYIEFPDDRTFFDTEKRIWRSRPR